MEKGLKTWHLWCTVGVLNIFDMAATYIGWNANIVEEKNPLMEIALENNFFIPLKLFLSLACLLIIYKVGLTKKGFYISMLPAFVYIFLFGAHIWWIYQAVSVGGV